MAKQTKIEPVKAWAVVNDGGNICLSAIAPRREDLSHFFMPVVRVLITPIVTKRKARGK